MRLVAFRRTGVAITIGAEVGSVWMAPFGMSFFFTSPASAGIDVVEAGMLNATQCQKPLPVGASGSYTVMAKLLASLGAPLQLRDGEMLPPLQPKTFALLLFGEMDATTATEALPQDLSRRRTRRADSRAQIGLARNFSAAGHSAIDCRIAPVV